MTLDSDSSPTRVTMCNVSVSESMFVTRTRRLNAQLFTILNINKTLRGSVKCPSDLVALF